LAFPLYALYEFGVVVSRFFEDPKNREAAFKQMQAESAAKKAAKEAAQKATMAAKKAKSTKKTRKTS